MSGRSASGPESRLRRHPPPAEAASAPGCRLRGALPGPVHRRGPLRGRPHRRGGTCPGVLAARHPASDLVRSVAAGPAALDPAGELSRGSPAGWGCSTPGSADRHCPGPRRHALGRSRLPGQLADEVQRLLERGQRSSSTLVDGDEQTTVQTIGRRGALRGILATAGTGALDAADQTVITSAIALLGLSLEQNRSFKQARGQLRGGLLRPCSAANGPWWRTSPRARQRTAG